MPEHFGAQLDLVEIAPDGGETGKAEIEIEPREVAKGRRRERSAELLMELARERLLVRFARFDRAAEATPMRRKEDSALVVAQLQEIGALDGDDRRYRIAGAQRRGSIEPWIIA